MSSQEILTYPSSFMSERTAMYQDEIASVWGEIYQFPEIRVAGFIVDQPTEKNLQLSDNSPTAPANVCGLEESKLIGVKTHGYCGVKFQRVTLYHLKQNATYAEQYPLKPISITHNGSSPLLPAQIQLEKWPYGYRVYGVDGDNNRFYHHDDAQYIEISEETATRAYLTYLHVRKPKDLEQLRERCVRLKNKY